MAKKNNVKCVLVGDVAVGKMTMADTYVSGEFPKEWVPCVFENRKKEVTFGDEQVTLDLWITCGLDGYERFRPLQYPGTDIFMVCFSLMCRASMDNVSLQSLSPIISRPGNGKDVWWPVRPDQN